MIALFACIASGLTWLFYLAVTAPEEWEDQDGFHYAEPRNQARRDHAEWLAKVLPGWAVHQNHNGGNY